MAVLLSRPPWVPGREGDQRLNVSASSSPSRKASVTTTARAPTLRRRLSKRTVTSFQVGIDQAVRLESTSAGVDIARGQALQTLPRTQELRPRAGSTIASTNCAR